MLTTAQKAFMLNRYLGALKAISCILYLFLQACSSTTEFDSKTLASVSKAWFEDDDTIIARGGAASSPEGSLTKKEANAKESARLEGQRQIQMLCLGKENKNASSENQVKEIAMNNKFHKLFMAVKLTKAFCGKDIRNAQVIICEVILKLESQDIRNQCREYKVQ